MATMLAVFVPQTCPPTPDDPLPHLCSIRENFYGISHFNQAVLAVNLACFVAFIACEAVIFRREGALPRRASFVASPSPTTCGPVCLWG